MKQKSKRKELIIMEKKYFVALVMFVVGGLLFSLGMCMCLLPEWNAFNEGVVMGAVGGVGIVMLLCLIPMFLGFR